MSEWKRMVSRDAYSDAISFFLDVRVKDLRRSSLIFSLFVIINLLNRISFNALIDTTGRDV